MATIARVALCVLMLITMGPVRSGTAQARTDGRANALLVGGFVGVPNVDGTFVPNLFTVGMHLTRARSWDAGPDLSIGTMPRVILEGIMVVAARGGVALTIPASERLLLLPSGGVTFLGAIGREAVSAVQVGGHFGFAAITQSDSPGGFRAAVTWHKFADLGDWVWLLELGFVRRRDKIK